VFVVAQFFVALANLLSFVLWAYMWVIIVRALLSWVSPDPYNPVVRFLHGITEPVLRPIRERLPTWRTGLDLSPLVVILIIYFLQQFLVAVLLHIARSMA
jgi:YggT family protein